MQKLAEQISTGLSQIQSLAGSAALSVQDVLEAIKKLRDEKDRALAAGNSLAERLAQITDEKQILADRLANVQARNDELMKGFNMLNDGSTATMLGSVAGQLADISKVVDEALR